MLKKYMLFFSFSFLLFACNEPSSSKEQITSDSTTATPPPAPTNQNGFHPATVDDATAERIKNFFINTYLQKDMSLMAEEDKKFNLYKIDLNEDGTYEYFVRFDSPYFCGKVGCTLLLLNNSLRVLNRYTMMPTPFYVSPKKSNGWNSLLVKSNGSFRAMEIQDGRYPSKFSELPASELTPDNSYQAIFTEQLSAKTYSLSDRTIEQLKKGMSEGRVSVFQRRYDAGNFTFKINAMNGEVTPIHISTEGLPRAFEETIEVEGAVKTGHLLDLNKDGFKELYLVIQPTGDSGNLDIIGIASYRDKSAGKIIVKDTEEIRAVNSDKIFTKDGELRRSFVQNGKQMDFGYELKKGETGFVLKAVKQ
ncbi:MAG: hypothetical protein AB8F74_11125 [Saprospiraceae bacterium]